MEPTSAISDHAWWLRGREAGSAVRQASAAVIEARARSCHSRAGPGGGLVVRTSDSATPGVAGCCSSAMPSALTGLVSSSWTVGPPVLARAVAAGEVAVDGDEGSDGGGVAGHGEGEQVGGDGFAVLEESGDLAADVVPGAGPGVRPALNPGRAAHRPTVFDLMFVALSWATTARPESCRGAWCWRRVRTARA